VNASKKDGASSGNIRVLSELTPAVRYVPDRPLWDMTGPGGRACTPHWIKWGNRGLDWSAGDGRGVGSFDWLAAELSLQPLAIRGFFLMSSDP
jgi:hypothetical protein